MPSYSTISKMLAGLSQQEAAVTLAHGRNPEKCGKLIFDNIQNYLRQRDTHIGRENTLNIGIAATYVEIEGISTKAFDLDDKRKRLSENKRKDVNVDQLLGMVDNDHVETIGVLQWLCTLMHYVPELQKWKEYVSLLYRTRGAKLPLPSSSSGRQWQKGNSNH
jgi:hypothetical protein